MDEKVRSITGGDDYVGLDWHWWHSVLGAGDRVGNRCRNFVTSAARVQVRQRIQARVCRRRLRVVAPVTNVTRTRPPPGDHPRVSGARCWPARQRRRAASRTAHQDQAFGQHTGAVEERLLRPLPADTNRNDRYASHRRGTSWASDWLLVSSFPRSALDGWVDLGPPGNHARQDGRNSQRPDGGFLCRRQGRTVRLAARRPSKSAIDAANDYL
jgi:hypothetical protein